MLCFQFSSFRKKITLAELTILYYLPTIIVPPVAYLYTDNSLLSLASLTRKHMQNQGLIGFLIVGSYNKVLICLKQLFRHCVNIVRMLNTSFVESRNFYLQI